MYITVKNINDFDSLVTETINNGISDSRIYFSENESSININFSKEHEKYIDFTYLFYGPLYTAIYSDTKLKNEYDKIYQKLLDIQNAIPEEKKLNIIQIDKITINKHTNVLTFEGIHDKPI